MQQLAGEGGFALVTGAPGCGKSAALRILAASLATQRDVTVGVISQLTYRAYTSWTQTGTGNGRVHRMPVAAIYASSTGRCITTGTMLGAPYELTPIPMETLNDIDYGDWQGLTHEEVARRQPEAYRIWRTSPETAVIPGGETLSAVVERVSRTVRVLQARHSGQTIAVVGHDGTDRLLLLRALDLPISFFRRLRQDPCCINMLERQDEEWILWSMNETSHLPTATGATCMGP